MCVSVYEHKEKIKITCFQYLAIIIFNNKCTQSFGDYALICIVICTFIYSMWF